MREIQPVQYPDVGPMCRFAKTADASSSHEFCAFEFPCCEGCPNALRLYVHRENLALFKKRLTERCTDAQRRVLQELLAQEQAKEPPLGIRIERG